MSKANEFDCSKCPNDGGSNDCRHYTYDGCCGLSANGRPIDCKLEADRMTIQNMIIDSKYPEFN